MWSRTALASADRGRAYGFSFDSRDAILYITIHEPNVGMLSELACDKYGDEVIDFEYNLEHGFGIDRVLETVGIDDGYLYLASPMESEIAPWLGKSVSMLLELCKSHETASKPPILDTRYKQLFELEIGRESAMGGCLSPTFVDWLEKKYKEKTFDTVPIREAMFRTRNEIYDFPVQYEPNSPNPYSPMEVTLRSRGRLSLDHAGASCMVEGYQRPIGVGHILTWHNVDSYKTQLTLLAGYARLHDIAAKEIDSPPS